METGASLRMGTQYLSYYRSAFIMILFWFYFSGLSNRIIRINFYSLENGASLRMGIQDLDRSQHISRLVCVDELIIYVRTPFSVRAG